MRLHDHHLLLSLLLAVGCASSHPHQDARAFQVRYSACADQSFGYGEAQILTVFGSTRVDPLCAYATTCDAFLDCLGLDLEAPCEPADLRCDGTVAVTCDGRVGATQREDCSSRAVDRECRLDDLGFPKCTSGETCEEGRWRCDGDAGLAFCDGGLLRHAACPADSRCVETSARAYCADRAEACEASRCVGDRLERCLDGEAIAVQDCGEVFGAGTCGEVDGAARCVSPTNLCDDGAVECAGEVARVCVEGAWIDYDCGSFGGGTCVEEADARVRCAL